MKKTALTLTIIANISSNFSESLGNIASVQKVYKNGRSYAIRSKESLKNAICIQSGMYNDLQTEDNGATQKFASSEVNASNCRALEGGYMNTKGTTTIRKSSFYLTDAIACDNFKNEARFHNNLYLASNMAKSKNLNLQKSAKEVGLMPYQYEHDKSLKVYSITIDLEMIGKDENYENLPDYKEADGKEKVNRVNSILDAVENLSLVVKGNLDNAEPVFVVGGLSERKTHYFENVVSVKDGELIISQDLKDKISKGYNVAVLRGNSIKNEDEIVEVLNTKTMASFFDDLREEVKEYYND